MSVYEKTRLEALISVYDVCDNDDNLRIRQPQSDISSTRCCTCQV